jgi:predicted CXXCH cytochrome family protein
MHEQMPVTQLPIGVVPDSRPGLRAFLMLLLCASAICATALAGPPPGKKAAAAPGKSSAAVSSDFVGADVCVACHEDVVKGFANNPHQKMVLMHGDSGVTCENCHGAGKAHVEGGGDKSKIFDFLTASSKQVNTQCLGCHAASHPNFQRSPHGRAGVSCTSCHSVHGAAGQQSLKASKMFASTMASRNPQDRDHLLKGSQPELCYSCHADQKAQFNMPFHHRVNEGLVQCTDCHNPHGTFGSNNLKSTADQNAVCTNCHTDVRGPFVFEHAPIKSEGCVACHTPHGSQNPRLLNMPTIATLCNQCHSPVAAGTVHGMGQGSATVTPCVTCHTFIHGSNASQAFIR